MEPALYKVVTSPSKNPLGTMPNLPMAEYRRANNGASKPAHFLYKSVGRPSRPGALPGAECLSPCFTSSAETSSAPSIAELSEPTQVIGRSMGFYTGAGRVQATHTLTKASEKARPMDNFSASPGTGVTSSDAFWGADQDLLKCICTISRSWLAPPFSICIPCVLLLSLWSSGMIPDFGWRDPGSTPGSDTMFLR